ncbi:hypothetical protein [Saccharothrix syringae]|uniref:TIGR04222 domain-containing membrane protein n=1 Tax=Saccharothrix syringae TaxID=103733 RepID=A0A5Q0H5K8_SACSY|nr:hypothetical protein [Saccharothrix syringae]QFZ21273.1 hypothetical protein EKG83_31270 [Saccharothrix syringae]
MTPEDEAMVIGGPRRVAEVAVAALVQAGALEFDDYGGVRAARTGGATTRAQQHVLALARRPGPLGALVDATAAHVRVEPYIERGLLVTPRRWRVLTPVFWLGNAGAVGVLVATALGLPSPLVLPLLLTSLAAAAIAAYLRGPLAGEARAFHSALRRTPLASLPPLNQVARVGLAGGAAVTPGRRAVGELLGVPGPALASLAPGDRGRVGGWWKSWVSTPV